MGNSGESKDWQYDDFVYKVYFYILPFSLLRVAEVEIWYGDVSSGRCKADRKDAAATVALAFAQAVVDADHCATGPIAFKVAKMDSAIWLRECLRKLKGQAESVRKKIPDHLARQLQAGGTGKELLGCFWSIKRGKENASLRLITTSLHPTDIHFVTTDDHSIKPKVIVSLQNSPAGQSYVAPGNIDDAAEWVENTYRKGILPPAGPASDSRNVDPPTHKDLDAGIERPARVLSPREEAILAGIAAGHAKLIAATAHLLRGEISEAERVLASVGRQFAPPNTVRKLSPDHKFKFAIANARVASAMQSFAEAARLFKDALRERPGDLQTRFELGAALIQMPGLRTMTEVREGLATLYALLEETKTSAEWRRVIGIWEAYGYERLSSAGEIKASEIAAERYEALLSSWPTDESVIRGAARFFGTDDKTQARALQLLRNAVNGGAEGLKGDLADLLALVSYKKSDETKLEFNAESEAYYRQAINSQPTIASLRYRFGRFLWWNKKDEAGAEEQLEAALKLDPKNSRVLCQHGLFWQSRAERLYRHRAARKKVGNALDRAEDLLRRAVRAQPSAGICHYYLAEFLYRVRHRFDDACVEYEVATEQGDEAGRTLQSWALCIDDRSVLRLKRRARSMAEDIDLEPALEHYERAVQLANDAPSWTHALAHFLEDKKEHANRALKLFEATAHSAESFETDRRICLAHFLESFGDDPKRAIDIYEQTARENPADQSAIVTLARARFARGDIAGGRELLRQLGPAASHGSSKFETLALFLHCAFGPASEADLRLQELQYLINAPDFECMRWDVVGLVDQLDSSCGVAKESLRAVAAALNGLAYPQGA